MSKMKTHSDKTSELGEKSIPRLVMSFALTTLAALILNSVYTLTDTLFVSRGVGDNAMGGVSVIFPFVIIQSAISTAVGGGAASLVSRKIGQGEKSEAGKITFNAMMTFYISALAITILGFIFMNPILKLMGVTAELQSYAKEYFTIILAGNVFSTGFSSIIRAEGKMLYGLLIWVIPISVNIVLDGVFILGLGMGVKGSAIATVICQFCSFLMSVLFFVKFSIQNFKGVRLSIKTIGEILSIGVPSLVQMGSISAASLLLNNILGDTTGTQGINIFAYISKLITFGIVPFTAVSQALAPITGFNFGAEKKDRVKKTLSFSVKICFAYSLIALLVAELLPSQLLGIFTENQQLIRSGISALRITALSLPLTFLPMLTGAYFQSTGKKLSALLLYGVNLVFLIPLAVAGAKLFGEKGVWLSYVLASLLSSAVSILRLKLKKRM